MQSRLVLKCIFFHDSCIIYLVICPLQLFTVESIVSQLNIYNMYGECYPAGSHLAANSNVTVIKAHDQWLMANIKRPISEPIHDHVTVKVAPPCINVTAITNYLNGASVRKALHIPESLPAWEICR